MVKKLPSQVAPHSSPQKKSKTIEEISQVEILDESIGTGVPSWIAWSGVVEWSEFLDPKKWWVLKGVLFVKERFGG